MASEEHPTVRMGWLTWLKVIRQFWLNHRAFDERAEGYDAPEPPRETLPERAKRLRYAIGWALLEAFVSVALGYAVGLGAGQFMTATWKHWVSLVLGLLSGVVVCWAVLGLADVQSIKRTTLVEEVNGRWYRGLTLVGFFLLSLSVGMGTN